VKNYPLESSPSVDEDSKLMDSIISSKVSQLKTLKDKVKKKNERNLIQTQNLERRLTQVQKQMTLLQSNQSHSSGELRDQYKQQQSSHLS